MFTSFFAFEMILKIISFGPLNYIRDPLNAFDGIIVILSFIEIVID